MTVTQKHKSNLVLSWSEVVYNGDQRKLCRNFQLQAGVFEHLITSQGGGAERTGTANRFSVTNWWQFAKGSTLIQYFL